MFIDASAIVAILTREPEAEAFTDAIQQSQSPFTSPLAIYEAVLAISRKRPGGLPVAEADLDEFLRLAGVGIAPLTAIEGTLAIQAFTRFGKGRHPAKLNMGDCFAYASARSAGCALLFKGNDFSKTDIAFAIAAH